MATVQMIAPGRFTILSTAIDDPDVMKFKLKALDVARSYCARGEGKYPLPPELFTLGPPDMTLKEIEVNHNQSNSKYVNLFYPYERLSGGIEILHCGQYLESEYAEGHALILNGIRDKKLFDCKRGLIGFFSREDDDPTKAISGRVPIGSMMFVYYLSVCQAVTHEAPYVPE